VNAVTIRSFVLAAAIGSTPGLALVLREQTRSEFLANPMRFSNKPKP
jgi:hypothetical protein